MTNANQSAFPRNSGYTTEAEGLTKLEYFSAKAMQGILANNRVAPMPTNETIQEVAEYSVKYAKALIAELEKEAK